MHVTRRVAARAVFHENALDTLAGNVRQLVLVDEGDLGVLRLRRIREQAAKRQDGEKQQTEDAFHGALSLLPALIGSGLGAKSTQAVAGGTQARAWLSRSN